MAAIDAHLFRATLLAEMRAAWHSLCAAHPDDHFYSFGLFTTDLASYLTVTASTEEGLSVVTKDYVARTGGDATLERAALRWNPCDSPLHGEGADLLPRSQDLRSAGPDPYDDTPESNAAVQLVFDVVLDVLSQLDRERVFGSGPERARIVIGVWMGDQSDEQRIEFARRLNPPATVQRFAEEMEAGYAAFQELARHRRNDG